MPRTDDYTQRLSVALKAAAYYRGVSAADLATRIGANVETVRRWMRAATIPSGEDLAAVADALDLPDVLLVRPPATRELALMMMGEWDRQKPSWQASLVARATEAVAALEATQDQPNMPSRPPRSLRPANGG